jgi:hypothetical protein
MGRRESADSGCDTRRKRAAGAAADASAGGRRACAAGAWAAGKRNGAGLAHERVRAHVSAHAVSATAHPNAQASTHDSPALLASTASTEPFRTGAPPRRATSVAALAPTSATLSVLPSVAIPSYLRTAAAASAGALNVTRTTGGSAPHESSRAWALPNVACTQTHQRRHERAETALGP